jgi:hypothetical protein
MAAAVVLLGGDGYRRISTAGPHPFQPPDSWDCRDVVSHLRGGGLDYRPVSTAESGDCRRSVFLTKTDKTWEALNGTLKLPERIDAWRGTVYCEKMGSPELQEGRNRTWGDCCLQLGAFVFFGDPAMLVEIAAALARSAPTAGIDVACAK